MLSLSQTARLIAPRSRTVLFTSPNQALPRMLPEALSGLSPLQHQKREYHVSKYQQQQKSSLLIGLAGVAVAAYGGGMLFDAIGKYIAARSAKKVAEGSESETGSTASGSAETKSNSAGNETGSKPGGFFSSFFQTGFYEGGFEDTMTRREAALILGIRESSAREKVVQAHRKLSLINHPDKGGSPFIAQKINEAKEVLLGSRR